MRYKLHPDVAKRVPFDPSRFATSHVKSLFDTVEVEDVTEQERRIQKNPSYFCIDVDETHNFVTSGGVVHNCRPPGNRDPLPDEIDSCRPYLETQIQLVDPKVIVTLGNFATRFMLENTAGISKVRGQLCLEWVRCHPHVPPRGCSERRGRGLANDAAGARGLRHDPRPARRGPDLGRRLGSRGTAGALLRRRILGGLIDLATGALDETRKAAAAVAESPIPGDVVSLTGELGAGSTAFVQGAAKALGVDEPVTSPTFVLVRQYRGAMPIYHVDVYRLDSLQEVIDLGFEDLLDPGGVVFVEWGDAIDALLPDSHLRVELRAEDDDSRRLQVSASGPAWATRWSVSRACFSRGGRRSACPGYRDLHSPDLRGARNSTGRAGITARLVGRRSFGGRDARDRPPAIPDRGSARAAGRHRCRPRSGRIHRASRRHRNGSSTRTGPAGPGRGDWLARRACVLGPLHTVQDRSRQRRQARRGVRTRSTARFPPGSRGRASICVLPSGWPPTWEASGEETRSSGVAPCCTVAFWRKQARRSSSPPPRRRSRDAVELLEPRCPGSCARRHPRART